MLEALKPNFAWAQQVPKDDKRIRADYVPYESPQGSGKMRGYLARPANAKGRLPTIVVIHENRGLNPYIEDVARRFATENFVAFAPDALTPVGGYPGNEEQAAAAFNKLDANKRAEDLFAAKTFIEKHQASNGKVGVVGFCFGGGIAGNYAVRFPDLAAAVSYYGAQPAIADVPKIKAPMLAHYASDDSRINAGWPAFEEALKANKIKHEVYIYPQTLHGFHNDTTPRFNKAAAELSWQRTLKFFKENVKA
jgi:carboxymethylenebutenolidase